MSVRPSVRLSRSDDQLSTCQLLKSDATKLAEQLVWATPSLNACLKNSLLALAGLLILHGKKFRAPPALPESNSARGSKPSAISSVRQVSEVLEQFTA